MGGCQPEGRETGWIVAFQDSNHPTVRSVPAVQPDLVGCLPYHSYIATTVADSESPRPTGTPGARGRLPVSPPRFPCDMAGLHACSRLVFYQRSGLERARRTNSSPSSALVALEILDKGAVAAHQTAPVLMRCEDRAPCHHRLVEAAIECFDLGVGSAQQTPSWFVDGKERALASAQWYLCVE